MNETTVQRELLCALNDAQLRERGDSMADAELAIERLKVERRKLNAQIREQSDLRAELAQAIESRQETRDVTCQWEPDYKRKTWSLRRMDTTQVIEELAMSEADMQGRIEFDDLIGGIEEVIEPPSREQRKRKATKRKATHH